jgi:hypothetical protein
MDLTPLHHRDYRLLYVGQAVSLLGTMITYVALPYQMYRLTGHGLFVTTRGTFRRRPRLITERPQMSARPDVQRVAGDGRCRDDALA